MIESGTCQNNKIRGYGHKQNFDWVCDLTSVITSVSDGLYFSFPSKNWLHTAEEQDRIGPYTLIEYSHILLGELIYFDQIRGDWWKFGCFGTFYFIYVWQGN